MEARNEDSVPIPGLQSRVSLLRWLAESATARKGTVMEKTHRIAQIYGYLVCLVAIITVLISVTALVSAILDLSDPLHAGWTPPGTASLASFDNYRADILKSAPKEAEAAKAGYVPDEQTLRAMYDAARNDKIQSVRHESNCTIIISTITIVICVVLFAAHWRWVKKLAKADTQLTFERAVASTETAGNDAPRLAR